MAKDPSKHCIKCNDELILDTNWTEGRRKRCDYICHSCFNKRRKAWRITNLERSREQGRKGDAKRKGSSKRIASNKKYWQSKKGKAKKRRTNTKRRGLGYTPLFKNPFADNVSVRWHHVSDEFIVAVPKDIHELYTGFKEHRELCMNVVNQIYIEGDR